MPHKWINTVPFGPGHAFLAFFSLFWIFWVKWTIKRSPVLKKKIKKNFWCKLLQNPPQLKCYDTRHWRDSRSRENLERKWSIFFYLELENWIFISRDALECQDFEEKILVLLSKFEILKKILFHFSKEWDFANRFSFSSRFFTQCLFQFSWEIIFCSLGWFWPSVFCRKGKYFKKTVLCCWAIFWLFSLQKHFMETTMTKSHLWEYFEWLPSGKGICKTCKNEIVDWFFYCIWYWL